MMSLEKETEKLMAFLKTQPLKSEGAEQEGQAGRKEGSELFYIGETVKGAESERAPAQASEEVESLLSCISPDCSYSDWFRVGCALKHEGCAYEVFRDWSARAPERFDEDVCERTWDSIGDDHDGKVSLGTLRWMAEKSFLPEPKTADEMAEQTLDFISTMFRPGEHFELVLKRGYYGIWLK